MFPVKIETYAGKAILSTVRIEVEYADRKKSIGTAFMFEYRTPGSADNCSVLLTNKHLVKDATIGRFVVRTVSKDGDLTLDNHGWKIEMDGFERRWIGHPDGDVDLCALP
jgi:hypothetical protein